MRLRDDQKVIALREATVAVVNSEGFASSSVQKIAKQAGVSPATLYIYFANKDALLAATFMDIKERMSLSLMADFDPDAPIDESLRGFWVKLFEFVNTHGEQYRFIDQFAYSPYMRLVDTSLLEAPYKPLHAALDRAQADGVIADIPRNLLMSFVLAPSVFLASSWLAKGEPLSSRSVNTAFSLAWKAISP